MVSYNAPKAGLSRGWYPKGCSARDCMFHGVGRECTHHKMDGVCVGHSCDCVYWDLR